MVANAVSSAEVLHRLLYWALLDIREQAAQRSDPITFGIADLLHNLPSELLLADGCESTYEHLLDELQLQARESGREAWLANTIAQIERTASASQAFHASPESA